MKRIVICFAIISLVLSMLITGCQIPLINNNPSAEPTSPSAATKATEKPTEKATEKQTQKATEAKKQEVASKTSPISANGYEICPVCTYVHQTGTSCPSCNKIPNQYNVKPEVNCPNCGGGYEVGGVVPWRYCEICADYFKAADGPYHNCISCGRSRLTPDDMSKQREGYCNACVTDKRCEDCGILLAKDEVSSHNGKRCMGCSECKYCGQYVRTEDYEYTGGFICSDCYSKHFCCICGAEADSSKGLLYGMCDECYEKMQEPNVWCPQCGIGFNVTGVGLDEFHCPQCGHNWAP